jgi:dicarboxylate transporter 10
MLRALYTFAIRDGMQNTKITKHCGLNLGAGIRSLWSGLSASILRQTTYSTARFGLYNALAQKAKQMSGGKLSSTSTIVCAGVAGGAAGMLGNPTEVSIPIELGFKKRTNAGMQVVLVRMCADGVKPAAERYRYPNALAGIVRIGREEGMKAFYKGLGPNVIRSILMSGFIHLLVATR